MGHAPTVAMRVGMVGVKDEGCGWAEGLRGVMLSVE